jgi:hypothetical protein
MEPILAPRYRHIYTAILVLSLSKIISLMIFMSVYVMPGYKTISITGTAILLTVCQCIELHIFFPFRWYNFYFYAKTAYWLVPAGLNVLFVHVYDDLFYNSSHWVILLPLILFHVNSIYPIQFLATCLPRPLVLCRRVMKIPMGYEIDSAAAAA